MNKPKYCKNLKEIRKSLKYTQADVALILGIRQEQYSKYESGKTLLPINYLVILCKVFKTSADTILF